MKTKPTNMYKFNEDVSLETKKIPKDLYDGLPDLLRESSDIFKSRRERDIFLTATIAMLSGCFQNVKGKYDKDIFYSNLNCLIVGPPASGKGTMNYSRQMIEKVHEKLEEEIGLNGLFMPANISSAAFHQILEENDGIAIIFETELDTMTAAIGQEWGNYSYIMRQAFQHERISYARQKDRQNIKIKKPKISIALSGTPNQVPKLLNSTGDGLFSRFIYYVYHTPPEWRDVNPKTYKTDVSIHFDGYSDKVVEIHNYFSGKDISFELTDEQFDIINEIGKNNLERCTELYGDDTASIVFRLGLISFRIAMVLTILRAFENDTVTEDNTLVCTDQDFGISQQLSDFYLGHALYMYEKLPKTENEMPNKNAWSFFQLLPEGKFSNADAVSIGGKNGFGSRTVSKHLKLLKDMGYLKQPIKNKEYIKAPQKN